MELKILLKKVDWNQMKKLNKQNKKKEKIWIRGNPLISILNTLILEWYSSISIQIAI